MNMLRSGVAWLQTVRKQSLADTVLYRRDGLSVSLSATPGNADFAMDATLTVRLENDQHDWIIAAADLVLAGQVTTPQRGDVIVFSGHTYQVGSPDGQSQPYALDATGQQMRIHTKRIS